MPTAKYLLDGKRVPSVTTVISDWPEGAIRWAEKGAAQAVAERMSEAHEIDPLQAEADMGSGLLEWRNSRVDQRDGGTWCHYLIERHLGMEPEAPSISILAQDIGEAAFANWLRWAEVEMPNVEILHAEEHLVSRMHRCGGTPDLVVREGGEVWVYDWKTSEKPKIRPGHIVQVGGAYAAFEEEIHGHKVAGVRIVSISNQIDGDVLSLRMTADDLGPFQAQFMALRALYDIKNECDRLTLRAIGQRLQRQEAP